MRLWVVVGSWGIGQFAIQLVEQDIRHGKLSAPQVQPQIAPQLVPVLCRHVTLIQGARGSLVSGALAATTVASALTHALLFVLPRMRLTAQGSAHKSLAHVTARALASGRFLLGVIVALLVALATAHV